MLKGTKHSNKAKKKISKSKKGHFVTKQTKQKQSKAHIGIKHSEKSKRKISESHKGKKHTEETKRKIRLGNEREKNGNWLGGISYLPYSVDWTETLKRSIRERDHYICQECNKYGNTVHHIDYDKKNSNPNNLITLCGSCHIRTNANRKYWKNYFKNKK